MLIHTFLILDYYLYSINTQVIVFFFCAKLTKCNNKHKTLKVCNFLVELTFFFCFHSCYSYVIGFFF